MRTCKHNQSICTRFELLKWFTSAADCAFSVQRACGLSTTPTAHARAQCRKRSIVKVITAVHAVNELQFPLVFNKGPYCTEIFMNILSMLSKFQGKILITSGVMTIFIHSGRDSIISENKHFINKFCIKLHIILE